MVLLVETYHRDLKEMAVRVGNPLGFPKESLASPKPIVLFATLGVVCRLEEVTAPAFLFLEAHDHRQAQGDWTLGRLLVRLRLALGKVLTFFIGNLDTIKCQPFLYKLKCIGPSVYELGRTRPP